MRSIGHIAFLDGGTIAPLSTYYLTPFKTYRELKDILRCCFNVYDRYVQFLMRALARIIR